MARIYPMFLVIASLVLLVLPGVLFNTYASTGFKTADPGLTCGGPYQPGQAIDFTCQGSLAEGCQAVVSDCSLTTNPTLSFLNQNSPFTQLIGGNIFGLFQGLTSNGNANRGPFDPNGGGQYYTADCFLSGVTGGAAQNMTTNSFSAHINACTQTNPDRSNMTKYPCGQTSTCFSTTPNTAQFQTFTWGDWNYQLLSASQVQIPFFHIWNNATYALTCYNQGYWFVTAQPTVGYSIIGCDYYVAAGYSPPANPVVNPVYSFLLAIPCNLAGASGCKAQTMPTGSYHVEVFVQPENWDTQFCTNAFAPVSQNQANWYGSQSCVNLETWFTTPHGGGLQAGFFTPFLTLLVGIVLFLIGTGINLSAGGSIFGTGTSFGVGTNRQGTKLAQILGLALIVWTPLYSEFSTWFSSGLLPFGLDGSITSITNGSGIIAFAITGLMFAGVTWQAVSDG